ncbi:endolytic transglycosylase MltG [Curvibacter sp. APW13]|nr:endolytic transglycosylase MltG [Curvibacter sp. APW13]MDT8991637.1 endolytic transglycosylase MltG [Curvibacter sp. APW13]
MAAVSWLGSPIGQPGRTLDLSIAPKTASQQVAQQVVQAGANVNPTLLYAWFRLSGQSRAIKAGSYELESDITPRRLLEKLVNGEQALRSVTVVEGWTFRQLRQALAQHPELRHDTAQWTDAAIMQALGRGGQAAEGRFFPDTYRFAKGSSDLAVLQTALAAMDEQLRLAWGGRAEANVLQSPDELLTLASIVEKETGAAADRGQVAAVFHNRLRIGMRLQTDPTVIYGLGERFDGNLRKADLQRDTPYNTYTRAGLPPTPIALPGKAALVAAARPDGSSALYFVAKGDGSSQFSTTLEEHNRAVNRYQRQP